MKTATIERLAVFGASHYIQHLTYRGETLKGATCAGLETLESLTAFAKREGFTRVRFVGDWKRYTVRKTMHLRSGFERIAERVLLGEHPTIDFDDLAKARGLDPSFVWTPETLAPYVADELKARK